jgi:hypothetical protein
MVQAIETELPLASAFFAVFFFLCFLATGFWVGSAACADDALEDGAGAESAAQAGTTIKANNNSNIFFMVTSPLWLKKHSRLALMSLG